MALLTMMDTAEGKAISLAFTAEEWDRISKTDTVLEFDGEDLTCTHGEVAKLRVSIGD